ncbi:hypothetical protein ACFVW2_30530 [Streptomyces sp. NPDC058171]
MLHRGIKFVHAAVLAFSAVLSFLVLRSMDEDWVLGHDAVVWVTDAPDSTAAADVNRTVREFSATHRATVGREVPDLKEPYERRHLYLTDDGPRTDWLADGYPAFNRGYVTETHPFTELGQRDPRGFYYVFGSEDTAASLARTFSELGLRSTVHQPHSVAELNATHADTALQRSFLVVALAVITMTGAGVLLNAKSYGVLRLQGLSFGALLLRDLRQLARFWVPALAVVTAVALALLGLYNGLAWAGRFALVTAAVAAALSAVALAAHAAMLWLTSQTDVLRALRGEIPSRAATVTAYLVRVPALILALGIASSVAVAGQDVLDRQDSSKAYARIGDTTSLGLNGSLGSEEALETLDREVGSWLRRADRDGQVIVVGHRDLQRSAPRGGMPRGDILLVNESFLAEQPVRDTGGRPIEAITGERDRVRLIVPEGLDRRADDLAALVPGLLNPRDPDKVARARLDTVRSGADQRVFTYNPRGQSHADENPGADESFVTDPVLVVFPNGSPYLSDKSYTAYASQRSVVFHDPQDVTVGVERYGLEAYVTEMSPVGENAALKLRELVGEFRLQLFNLAVAVAVLLITGVGVCIVHSRKNSQRIFARHINGWTFAATHRPILVVEAALAALLAVWFPLQVWQRNQDLERYAALGVPSPRPPAEVTALDLGVTGGLVAIEVAAVLLALVVFHRRIVKEGATGS